MNSTQTGWIKLAAVFIAGLLFTHLLLMSSNPIEGMQDVIVRVLFPVMVGMACGFIANGLMLKAKGVKND